MFALTGSFLVDKVGRRPLFLTSTIGMLVGGSLLLYIEGPHFEQSILQRSRCGRSLPHFSMLATTLPLPKVHVLLAVPLTLLKLLLVSHCTDYVVSHQADYCTGRHSNTATASTLGSTIFVIPRF